MRIASTTEIEMVRQYRGIAKDLIQTPKFKRYDRQRESIKLSLNRARKRIPVAVRSLYHIS